MSFNESNTVEQMILDAIANLGRIQISVISILETTAAVGKSGRGLPHSRTLRAVRSSPANASRLGLRWPSTAIAPGGVA